MTNYKDLSTDSEPPEKTTLKLYSSAEVEPMLGLCRSSIDTLCKTGKLDRYKFGRSARISHESIMRYLQESRNKVLN